MFTLNGGVLSLSLALKSNERRRSTCRCGRSSRGYGELKVSPPSTTYSFFMFVGYISNIPSNWSIPTKTVNICCVFCIYYFWKLLSFTSYRMIVFLPNKILQTTFLILLTEQDVICIPHGRSNCEMVSCLHTIHAYNVYWYHRDCRREESGLKWRHKTSPSDQI